jgi:hypothetical protein
VVEAVAVSAAGLAREGLAERRAGHGEAVKRRTGIIVASALVRGLVLGQLR